MLHRQKAARHEVSDLPHLEALLATAAWWSPHIPHTPCQAHQCAAPPPATASQRCSAAPATSGRALGQGAGALARLGLALLPLPQAAALGRPGRRWAWGRHWLARAAASPSAPGGSRSVEATGAQTHARVTAYVCQEAWRSAAPSSRWAVHWKS